MFDLTNQQSFLNVRNWMSMCHLCSSAPPSQVYSERWWWWCVWEGINLPFQPWLREFSQQCFKFAHACLPWITWVSTSCSFRRSTTGQRVLWQSGHCAGGHQSRPWRLEGCSRQAGQRDGRPIRVRLGLLAALLVNVSNTWLVSHVNIRSEVFSLIYILPTRLSTCSECPKDQHDK